MAAPMQLSSDMEDMLLLFAEFPQIHESAVKKTTVRALERRRMLRRVGEHYNLTQRGRDELKKGKL